MKKLIHNRSLLVHQHIFGNAGEFVDQCLHASFANEWRQVDQDFPGKKYLSSADVSSLQIDGGGLQACSTMYPINIEQGGRLSYFVLLADPIVRAKQVFLRVAGDSTQPNSELARELGFKGYVEWALSGGYGGVVICNYQTLHLSDVCIRDLDIVQSVAGNQEFCEAINHLKKVDFVGLADRAVCSMKELQGAVGPDFPELQMDNWLRYFAGQPRSSIPEQRAAIKSEIGDDLFERLLEANRFDAQLYESALKGFCSRVGCAEPEHAVSGQECGCFGALNDSAHKAERRLFFLHIPKTAGTAFSLHLKNQFGHDEVCPAGYWPELLEIPNVQRAKYKLVSGHFSDLARALFEPPVNCLTVLREPVERVTSLLRYQNHLATGESLHFSHKSINELANCFREQVVKGFSAMLNTSNYRILESLSNYQVRVISGAKVEPSYVLTRNDLNMAKRNLLSYQFIGLTERMQDSLEMLAYTFEWPPIPNVVMNETPKNSQCDNFSCDLLDRIIDMNKLDIELYTFAKDLFEHRYEEMRTRLQHEFGCAPSLFDKLEFRHALAYEKVRSSSLSRSLGYGAVGSGWYGWESNSGGGLRWTGPGQNSYLDLPVIKQCDLLISFRIAGYASEAILTNAIISVDGVRLSTAVVIGSSGELYLQAAVELDKFNLKLPFLRVGIHLVTTMSAKDINPAARNNRRLGLAIHALKVCPVDEGIAA